VNWKEVKSAVIYRLEQSVKKPSGRGMLIEKYVVAQPPTPNRWTLARRCGGSSAAGIGRARKVYVVIDGAVWLWNVAKDRFSQAIHVLDFHHASEHLWAMHTASWSGDQGGALVGRTAPPSTPTWQGAKSR